MSDEKLLAAEAPPRRVGERFARPLFLLTIITGSFLLFLTQPMIARMALPRVGGSPSVWNSAMLVYPAAAARRLCLCALALPDLRPRLQVGIHLVLLGRRRLVAADRPHAASCRRPTPSRRSGCPGS